jgi:hypothetical protein
MAKIKCLNCNQPIADIDNNILAFNVMNVVSKIEIDFSNSSKQIKCRCGCWNAFDSDNSQSINYKKRGEEALYSATNFNNAMNFNQKRK